MDQRVSCRRNDYPRGTLCVGNDRDVCPILCTPPSPPSPDGLRRLMSFNTNPIVPDVLQFPSPHPLSLSLIPARNLASIREKNFSSSR